MSKSKKILSPDRLTKLYGPFASQGAKLSLNPANVPSGLRSLMHYAAFWGVADDGVRTALAEGAPEEVRANLTHVLDAVDDELDEWLAGPEAAAPNPSPEYVAFSAMRMVADYLGE
ncbi:hypothetical protein [Gemmata sp.]|uniref:hypothetical protein n=1 Tax=Gemmata sp. TaxID=1914242 RepID=UPI003F71C534